MIDGRYWEACCSLQGIHIPFVSGAHDRKVQYQVAYYSCFPAVQL